MSQTSNVEMNKKLLAEKKASGCEDCGYNAHPAALALDHIDPSTKHVTRTGRRQNPGAMLSYKPETFRAELEKCRVLCHNCHSIHTVMQSNERRASGENLSRGVGRVSKMSVTPVIMAA
jgi:hypothetical protein